MSDAWGEYLEALRVLRRAPEAALARLGRIDAAAVRATQAADEALRSAVARREALDRRVEAVGELLHTALTEEEFPAAGPVPAVRLPRPGSLDEALDAADRIERLVHDDLDRLAAARLLAVSAPKPRRWRRYALVGAGVLTALAAIVFFTVR